MTAHALTIDLEDWHQLRRPPRHRAARPAVPGRRRRDPRLLDLLDETAVRATFFVLGIVAEAFPELVRESSARPRGREPHIQPRARVPDGASRLQGRHGTLGQAAPGPDRSTGPGVPCPRVLGRPPGHWCFEVLAELGFRYDSSVFPLSGPRYGIPSAPRHPFTIETRSGPIREFPLAVWDFGPARLPVAGGTYYRLLPGRDS